MMDANDKLLDSYHSRSEGEHGWDYSAKIYADVNGCVWVDEAIQHFDRDYPEDESYQFTTFEEAWAYYFQRAAYSEYHGKFFDNGKRKALALRLYGGKQLADDLANLEVDEILCGADTVPEETPVETVLEPVKEECECKLHPEIQRHLSALEDATRADRESIAERIADLESKLEETKAALESRDEMLRQINSLLHPESVKVLNAPEEFSLSSCLETMTATELAQQLGIKPKKIYDALDKGELKCLPRVPRGKVRFDRQQAQSVVSYFGGMA